MRKGERMVRRAHFTNQSHTLCVCAAVDKPLHEQDRHVLAHAPAKGGRRKEQWPMAHHDLWTFPSSFTPQPPLTIARCSIHLLPVMPFFPPFPWLACHTYPPPTHPHHLQTQ
jgi:hypothetical protein